jgi:hypothetical protein
MGKLQREFVFQTGRLAVIRVYEGSGHQSAGCAEGKATHHTKELENGHI